jgi:hypothetical protein
MPQVGFEPTIPVFERAKTIHTLDRAAAVIGLLRRSKNEFLWSMVEYLHRSPASGKRRRKGNPVPGGITGPPCSWGISIQGPGPPCWGSLESETVKCGHESRGTLTWQWLRWRGPAAIVKKRPILSPERVLPKDYNRMCSVGKWNYWSWVSRGLSPRRTDWR